MTINNLQLAGFPAMSFTPLAPPFIVPLYVGDVDRLEVGVKVAFLLSLLKEIVPATGVTPSSVNNLKVISVDCGDIHWLTEICVYH